MPKTSIYIPQGVWKALKEAEYKESIKQERNVTFTEVLTIYLKKGLELDGYNIEEEKAKK